MPVKTNFMRFRDVALRFLFILTALLPVRAQFLTNIYKKGPIVLKNTAGYGEKTDWTALFYNTFTDIITAPDGSVFAASSRQHKIFKFDAAGSLIKSFGRKGQGTGDFNSPDNLSILDGRYLVVGEYALGHRISLFDLEGTFVSLLKTELAAYQATAMHNGTIAYVGLQHRDEGGRTVQIASVRIKDVRTGLEKYLCSHKYPLQSIRLKRGSIGFGERTAGNTFIAQNSDGNLIVGNSMNPELEIYDITGKRTAVIQLDMDHIPVTRRFIREYKKSRVDSMREESASYQEHRADHLKEVGKADFSILFGDHLPYYNSILVDGEGNILIFFPAVCLDRCPIKVRIYSGSGDFCCETEIDSGDYELIIDPRRRHMCFTPDGLFALVQPKRSEDFLLRLIKVTY